MFPGNSRENASSVVTVIAYDSTMAVLRMVIDVQREWGSPADRPRREPQVDVLPLDLGGRSRALVGAVATSCGLRSEGLLSEVVSRPGRHVHGWGAVLKTGDAPPTGFRTPEAEANLAGVILLAESTPASRGAPGLSIPWLLVRPECRRAGVGRALVGAALERCRAFGAARVTIDTLDRWPEAVAFWRSVGFTPGLPPR